MEADAGRVEAELGGQSEDFDGLADRAAVLARQRPVGALAGRDQPAQHGGTRRGLGDLADLGQRVDHEDPHAEGRRLGDVVPTLHRVGVDEVVRGCARREGGSHLGGAGHVEVRAGRGNGGEDGRMRVRLHGVVDGGAGQGGGQGRQAFRDDGRLDLEEGRRGQVVHLTASRLPCGGHGRRAAGSVIVMRVSRSWCGARGQGVALRGIAKTPGDTCDRYASCRLPSVGGRMRPCRRSAARRRRATPRARTAAPRRPRSSTRGRRPSSGPGPRPARTRSRYGSIRAPTRRSSASWRLR